MDNAEGAGSRLMSLYDATVASTNVVYAQLSLAVGPDKIVDVAHRMGIESDIPDVPSVALGSGAVSLLETASAYLELGHQRALGIVPTSCPASSTPGVR